MFVRSWRRRRIEKAVRRRSREWRRCAQAVGRAWNEWLAADEHQRALRYLAYCDALAEEQQAAAAMEHSVRLKADAPAGSTPAGASHATGAIAVEIGRTE